MKKTEAKKTKMGGINYPAGDFLIRIKNISRAGKKVVVVRNTKFIKDIAECLVREGFLLSSKVEDGELTVHLAFHNKMPLILDIKLVSRPGLRNYISVDDLEKIKGPETVILSTSQGVLSAREALQKRVAGEVLAKIL